MGEANGARILVMGCGGIGGTVTAHLAEVGADVTAVTTNETIAAAVQEQGFRITGDGNPRTVAAHEFPRTIGRARRTGEDRFVM